MLLIWDNPDTREVFFGEQGAELMGEVEAIIQELTESGELVGGEALADPSNTKTVRVRDGVPAVTDGPFVESKEQLVGYCIVESETPERATEIAARWPDARYWAMEVRPIMGPAVEDLLRELAPQVLGALVRRYGHFDACEDAVQEALLAATVQWPDQGLPQNPRGWLITVASRRVTDQLRSDQARRRREDTTAAL